MQEFFSKGFASGFESGIVNGIVIISEPECIRERTKEIVSAIRKLRL